MTNSMKKLLAMTMVLLVLWSRAHTVYAGELKPLERGGFAQIKTQFKGKPFIVVFWSTDCPHCKPVLPKLNAFAQRHSGVQLIIINTDSMAEQTTIQTMLASVGLEKAKTWVFNDQMPERLRYEIDPKWRGEMPRTYLFNADHSFSAIDGMVSSEDLKAWSSRNAISAHGKLLFNN